MNNLTSDKQRVFFLLCLAHIAISFNLAAVAAVIPSISQDLLVSDVQAARVIPYYLWAYGLGALIYAPLTRYYSVKTLLLSAIAVFSLSSLCCGLTKSIQVLFVANFINGLAASSVVPLALITIGKLFNKEERGRAVGRFFSVSFMSSLLGVVASGSIHWSFLFIIPLILGIITIINILLVKINSINMPFGRAISYVNALRVADIQKVFIFIFLMSFVYHGIHKWYGVYLYREYQLSQWLISALILVTSVSGAVGQIYGGILTDQKSRLFTIVLGLGILGTAAGLLSGHYSLIVLGILLAMISIGWTVSHNGLSTVLTDFPDQYRSEMASLNSSIRFLAGGLGFYLSGFLVAKSFSLNFLIMGAAFLALLPWTKFFISGHLNAERT